MAAEWNESSLPSSSYSSVFKEEDSQDGWTFVDFFPDVIKPEQILEATIYTNFKSLVERANNWLRVNPQWEIKTCESVQFRENRNMIDSEEMIYFEYGEAPNSYNIGLRLWFSSRKDNDNKCQQIGYLNLVPEETKPSASLKPAIYESLDDVVNKFNKTVNYQPIPGRIITIETKKLKVYPKGVYPDNTKWISNAGLPDRFLYFLRIFYEITEPAYEEIAFQHFIPSVTDKGGFSKLPKYEEFCNTVKKASDWCSQQTEVRIFNVQTLEVKVERGKEVDTQKMNYSENDGMRTFYLRVLRVAYTKSVTDSKLYPVLSLPQLTCKSFIPVQISASTFKPKFETLQQTKARVSAWIKATGAQVNNAETSCVIINFSGNGYRFNDETTYTYSSKEKTQNGIYVLRIYLDRHYPEPPEGTLPPVPVLTKSKCSIS